MKTILKVPHTKEVVTVNHIEVEAELPDTEKYYMANDDGRMFPRGIVLFAMIPKYGKAGKYFLYEVERNKQDFTDFEIESDLKKDYVQGLRDTALHILLKHKHPRAYTGQLSFKEIEKVEFDTTRDELLKMK